MARYVADPDRILALVDKARRIGEQIDKRIVQVEQEIAALHVEWDGVAADAHRGNTDTWRREMHDMNAALAALESAARSARDGYLGNVEHNRTMWP